MILEMETVIANCLLKSGFQLDSFEPTEDLWALGLDSLHFVQWILCIESELKLTLNYDSLDHRRLRSVRDLALFIRENHP